MTSTIAILAMAAASLQALASDIKADGHIDDDETNALREEIYDDGTVETAEVATLFSLADACTYEDSFATLLSDAVRDWGYADGELDSNEAEALRNFIEADGAYSDLETRILNEVLNSGATMPDAFRTWATSVTSA